MTSKLTRWLARTIAVVAVAFGTIGLVGGTAAAAVPTGQDHAAVSTKGAADGTPEGAVQWYEEHEGDTGWEHYCEKAAENAYGTTGVWPSAIAHWEGASEKHEGDTNPPLGAFVYWNISDYGHVGVSDGNGGAWATSVDGAIGHIDSLDYFGSYLGWTPGDVPSQ